MKNNKSTEIVFVLDISGSMCGLERATADGFNSFIAQQREIEGECIVSAVLFNAESHVLYNRVPLDKVNRMSARDIKTNGCTALFDAVGDAINHIGDLHKHSWNAPEKTIFVIITDGYENASRKYTHTVIREMIQRQERKYGWEFLFMGANIDAKEFAETCGIDRSRAVDYCADECGTELNFESVSRAAAAVRCDMAVPEDWSDAADRYNKKKR